MEIERKFLLKQLPEGISPTASHKITQAYISGDPVIRLRQEDDRFELTVKGKGALAREELNLPLTEEAYARLLKKTEGNVIRKTRLFVPLPGGLTAEIDLFEEPFAPLKYVEVEFGSPEAAEAFTAPDWFGEEVTYRPGYSNADLAFRGLPHQKT